MISWRNDYGSQNHQSMCLRRDCRCRLPDPTWGPTVETLWGAAEGSQPQPHSVTFPRILAKCQRILEPCEGGQRLFKPLRKLATLETI